MGQAARRLCARAALDECGESTPHRLELRDLPFDVAHLGLGVSSHVGSPAARRIAERDTSPTSFNVKPRSCARFMNRTSLMASDGYSR
jgi:hypothetical protein